MGTIICAVCGEPWDRYGIEHGDVSAVEALNLLQGRGCPCCEGIREDGGDHTEDAMRSAADSWDGDPIEALLNVADNVGKPYDLNLIAPITIAECHGCGVRLTANPANYSRHDWREIERGETPDEYRSEGRAGTRWQRDWREPDLDQWHVETQVINGVEETHHYCEHCHESCDQCGDVVLTFEGAVDMIQRQEGMTIETYHHDCFCEVEHEEHMSYVEDRVDSVVSDHDLELAPNDEIDYGTLASDLGWYDNGSEPEESDILNWILSEHHASLTHYEYGGPYSEAQWNVLLHSEEIPGLYCIDLDCSVPMVGGKATYIVARLDCSEPSVFKGSRAECNTVCARLNVQAMRYA